MAPRRRHLRRYDGRAGPNALSGGMGKVILIGIFADFRPVDHHICSVELKSTDSEVSYGTLKTPDRPREDNEMIT